MFEFVVGAKYENNWWLKLNCFSFVFVLTQEVSRWEFQFQWTPPKLRFVKLKCVKNVEN